MMEKARNFLKIVRHFILCLKNTTEEIDSVIEDINDLQLFEIPQKTDSQKTDS